MPSTLQAGGSDGSESEDVVPLRRPNDPSDTVLNEVPVTRATRAGFASLKSTPHFLRDASGVGGN